MITIAQKTIFVNRKSVQLVDAIHMLIGLTDIFAKHIRQKVRNQTMTKISETDYPNMSKDDLYKEYCKIYNEYEKLVEQEIKRLKMELNAARIEFQLSHIQKPMPKYLR